MKALILTNLITLSIIFLYEISTNITEWFQGGNFLFSIINNLSYSVLASSIFWIILEYIPRKNKEKYAKTYLEKDILKLVEKMYLLNYWLNNYVTVEEECLIKVSRQK